MQTLIKIIKIGFFILFGGAVMFLSLTKGDKVTLSVHLEIVNRMRDTASLILAILGMWIAVVYPGALANIFKKQNGTSDVDVVRNIFLALRISTVIVLYSILAIYFYPVLKEVDFFIQYKTYFKPLLLMIEGCLSLLLFYSLFLSLIPLENASCDLNSKKEISDSINRRNRGV